MGGKDLVICPVYNEESTFSEFFSELRRHYQGDVLFIDDGSMDTSKEKILEKEDERTFLIRNPKRTGYGATLLVGFAFATQKGYERVVTIDVDLQHKPRRIPEFFDSLAECDVVLGSRYLSRGDFSKVPQERLRINRKVAAYLKERFSASFSDPFCGYRGYRGSFLESAYLAEKSYGLAIEVLLELIRLGARFKEIPVEVIYRDSSRSFLDGLDSPERRLSYYMDIIARRREGKLYEEKVPGGKPSSR